MLELLQPGFPSLPKPVDRLDHILDKANKEITKPVYSPVIILRLSNAASKKERFKAPKPKGRRPLPSPKPPA